MQPSFLLVGNNTPKPVLLPGVRVGLGEDFGTVAYSRYLGDETLRRALNSLVSRNDLEIVALEAADQSTFLGGEYDLSDYFPILTAGELEVELAARPLVPEVGRAIILAEEPSDDSLALGQGALYMTNDPANAFTVRVKAKGSYAQLTTEEGVIYTALRIGQSGNEITVAHVVPGENNEGSVTVDGKDITVTVATSGDAVAAATQADGLSFTAKTPGAAGNGISVATVELSDDLVAATTADLDGEQIVVTLAQSAMVPATMTTAQAGSDNDVVFTGDASLNGSTIHLRPNGAGSTIQGYQSIEGGVNIFYGDSATAQDLIDFIADTDDNPQPLVFTAALAAGNDGTGTLETSGDETYTFAGGVVAAVTATKNDLKAAIEADSESNALVAVAVVSGGGDDASADIEYQLAGGADADTPLWDASDIADAVNGDPVASLLVTSSVTSGYDDNPGQAMEATSLETGSDSVITRGVLRFAD